MSGSCPTPATASATSTRGADPRLVEIFNKAADGLPGFPVSNLDALHDVLAEYGAGWRVVVRRAAKMDGDARRMLEDASKEVPGFTVAFRGR